MEIRLTSQGRKKGRNDRVKQSNGANTSECLDSDSGCKSNIRWATTTSNEIGLEKTTWASKEKKIKYAKGKKNKVKGKKEKKKKEGEK